MDHDEDAEPTGDIPEPDDHHDDTAHPDDGELDSSILDDAFVAGATIHEPSASERLERNGPFGRPQGAFGGTGIGAGFEPTRVFITSSRKGTPGDEADRQDPGFYGPTGSGGPGDFYGSYSLDDDELLHQRSLRRRRRRRRIINALALLVVVATFAVYGLDHFVTGIEILPWTRMNRALSGNEAPAGDTAIAPPHQDPIDDTADDPVDGSADPEDRVKIIRGENWPPAPTNPSNERVLAPVIATTTGPHEFVMTQDDGSGPVAYDPCRPIPYVVSGASKAPLEGRQLLDEALAVVSGATGLAFVDEGTTTERPSDQRRSYQPNRYGQRWAPVLIAWSDPTESPRLSENSTDIDVPDLDVLGYAGSNAVGLRTVEPKSTAGSDASPDPRDDPDPDHMIYVTGTVTLDGPDFASLLQTPGGYEIARAAIMHELGHLVGLGHIDDPGQLMYPAIQPGVTSFGGGDLEGLATLGSGVCMPEI